MKKYKYLLKNIGLLTISNFGSKILSFLLVPLYTSILTTSEYGTFDLYVVTVTLLLPILSIGIVNGVMRYALEKETNNKSVFSIGLIGVSRASLIFAIIVGANYFFNIIPTFNEFPVYFVLYFVSEAFYDLLSTFARGVDRVNDYAIAGIINSVIMLSTNVLFLVVFKMGLGGYFLANCLARIVPTIYLALRVKAYKYISLGKRDKALLKDMNSYSSPLVVNTISWWVNNVSDRYIITWLCGTSANGIYSVAYKIPSIINVFQTIISQAWLLSAVKEYDDEDKSFYAETYKIYNVGLILICSVLIVFNQLIAKILFAKDFYEAWKYAPFLMISVVFGALTGHIGAVFTASKESKVIAKTTTYGAVINLALNIVLVKYTGAIGAAIATMVSYFIVWVMRYIYVKRTIEFKINLFKDLTAYALILAQAVVMLLVHAIITKYLIIIALLLVVILIYMNDIKKFAAMLLTKLKQRKVK